jgi:exopolyphosphatase
MTSLALGVNKGTETLDDTSTALSQFLYLSKERYLSNIHVSPSRGGDWTIVMGNKAGGAYISPCSLKIDPSPTSDLDSIISSIAFAWIQSEVLHNRPTIPLIQMRTNDFSLRPENLHTLFLAGLTSPTSQLLTLSSLSFMTIFPSHNLLSSTTPANKGDGGHMW